MFQYIRKVRVEYVIRISSVTTLYIDYWNVCSKIYDMRTDRQTDRHICITETETQFYKLRKFQPFSPSWATS